jgi:CheY-like chemotaxis protein
LARLTPIGGIVNNPQIPFNAKVLLVDDERQQLELRALVLSMAGFSVFTATGPLQALSLASRIRDLDIAILDYEMPIMNGCELAKHLKAKFPKLNIVLYSGAVTIPPHDLENVHTFISKSDGIPVLLHHLSILSAEVTGARHRSEPAAKYNNPESPPRTVRAEPNFLPSVLAATNVM